MENKKTEILFMQTRLIRLASERWKMSIEQVVTIFKTKNVFHYIEVGYGIFHCEGDDTVLDEIEQFLKKKGVNVYAGIN